MPEPLVETKLLLPRSRARTVARPRLDELLAPGSDAPLTLVSAPAGFGKTTLLGTWLASRCGGARPTAWVSLDERDRDASSFWTYVLRAVDRAARGHGAQRPWRAPVAARLPVDDCADRAAQRAQRPPDGPHPRAGRLPPRRRAGRPARHGLPPRPPAAAGAPRHQHPGRPGAAAGPPAGPRPAGRDPGRRPPLHRRRRPPPTSTTSTPSASPLRTSLPWRAAPRAGRRRCSWRRSPCRAAATSPGSSPGSPATTGSSSTTSPTRSSTASRPTYAGSCSTPRSSTG